MARTLRSLFFLGIAILFTMFPGELASAATGDHGATGPSSIRDHLSLVVPLEENDRGNVGYTTQRGSYMSAVFGKQNFIILDMDSGQVLYQASFGQPLYRSAEIFGNFVLLQPQQVETMTRIDIFSGEKKEMEDIFTSMLDKKGATRAAMMIYEPIIRDMARMAGILAQIALLGN